MANMLHPSPSLHPSPPSSISSSRSGSRLSFLSTSSSSTFSDFSVCSLPSPPASGSKTHAFFGSPFPTRPPSPKTTSVPVIDVSTPKITTPTPSFDSTPRPKDLEPASLDEGEPCAGSIICGSPSTTLRLLKPLGHGAFSSVWLADDLSPVPLVLRSRRSLRDLRRQASLRAKSPTSPSPSPKSPPSSLSRAGSLRKLRARVPGTRPILRLENNVNEFGAIIHDDQEMLMSSLSRASSTSSSSSHVPRSRPPAISILDPPNGSASLSRSPSAKGRMVAVKMTVRGGAACGVGDEDEEREKEKERTRVAFVREVEVLRHISHPNITPLLTHLSTPTHHVLVLPFLPGGDLLALVNTDTAWTRLRESVLKRIWSELCKAVGWMHGVGLVHRDVKLENILLTTPTYTTLTPTSPAPTLADLPVPPAPLIKLTDFGLSRFVDIRSPEERMRDRRTRRRARVSVGGEHEGEEDEDEDEDEEGPLLSTRCGSEAYAAPELVMGGGGPTRSEPSPPAPTPSTKKRRPKESQNQRGVYDARETDAWACGVVLFALVGRRLPFGEGGVGIVRDGAGGGEGRGRMARRAWLMRIARGEYEWPEVGEGEGEEEEELVGPGLVRSEGARRIVGRLLVRDPRRRARIADLWGDVWMGGEGVVVESESESEGESESESGEAQGEWEEEEEEEMGEEELEEALREAEEEVETDGWLVDQEGIDDVARREVI